MATVRAAEVVKRRLAVASRRLGTHNPVESVGGLIDSTFDLALGDPRYGRNALVPGSLPLEHSFSETSAGALRFELEPLGPQASPSARQHEASRVMRSLVQRYYGRPALRWFDQQTERFRASHLHGGARFGAFFGASYDESGLDEAKVYYELGPGGLDDLPPNLLHACRVAMSCLPELIPFGVSVACRRHQGAERVYFFHRGELRLLDMEPMMNRLGVGERLPSVLSALGLILGGRFTLPEGSAVVGLRDTTRGIEMRLDVLLSAIHDPPRQMHGLIQMQLEQRPESLRALRHWCQAMTPDDHAGPGDISVVGVRVSPAAGSRLSLYFRPCGYDQAPSRGREERHEWHEHREHREHDPYTLHG